MTIVKICNQTIEYSFYALFFLIPLVLSSSTSELFEFNKMWLTWSLAIIIACAWGTKMILQRRILFQKTPLDIPIVLFLVSQIISTIFSLDSHVSFWGYYSRFNGGLLSMLTYAFLYYAFVSNLLNINIVKRILYVSLATGVAVALWGLPSHFGYDPTCLLFRGNFGVSCWTADFQPKIRIFSTLGQPDWLAAYLAILLPISIALTLKVISDKGKDIKKNWLPIASHLFLIALFYIDLLYSGARSGFIAFGVELIFFVGAYLFFKKTSSGIGHVLLIIIVVAFFIGTPINSFNKFTLNGIKASIEANKTTTNKPSTNQPQQPAAHSGELGGTDSGKIRLIVWKGAIDAWRHYPIIGSGVETFAYAYYKFRPVAHNMTSEWNFLYNKAHNEFLNYLTTTGIFGLGSYMLMIGWFLTIVILRLKAEGSKILRSAQNDMLTIALIASYFSILITNFLGFSVVITNIYLFMIPAFVFVLEDIIKIETRDNMPFGKAFALTNHRNEQGKQEMRSQDISLTQWLSVSLLLTVSLFSLITLLRFWMADKSYALGFNLDRAGDYQQAYLNLQNAVSKRNGEPVFIDEMAVNNATLATAILSQKNTENATNAAAIGSKLRDDAINYSNDIVSKHPNNMIFWKSRTKVFYTLAQVDSKYLPQALVAIKKAHELAPTDANVYYNLGVLYGQNNNIKKGIEALEQTIKLKPNYRDAYYALGLFYKEDGQTEKAIEQMEYIIKTIIPNDSGAQEALRVWKK